MKTFAIYRYEQSDLCYAEGTLKLEGNGFRGRFVTVFHVYFLLHAFSPTFSLSISSSSPAHVDPDRSILCLHLALLLPRLLKALLPLALLKNGKISSKDGKINVFPYKGSVTNQFLQPTRNKNLTSRHIFHFSLVANLRRLAILSNRLLIFGKCKKS